MSICGTGFSLCECGVPTRGNPLKTYSNCGKANRLKPVPLQDELTGDARAGVGAKAIATADLAAGQRAASSRRLRRWPARASADHRNRWRAECDRSRRQRADVLRK